MPTYLRLADTQVQIWSGEMFVVIWAEFALCFGSLLAAGFFAWDEARIGAELKVVQVRSAKA